MVRTVVALTALTLTLTACSGGRAPEPDPPRPTTVGVTGAADPEAGAAAPAGPPMARRVPKSMTTHGDTREDPYYWLRDDARKDPEVLAYLNAENAWLESRLAPAKALRAALFEELKGRIQEDDSTPPVRLNGWWYYTRYAEGLEHPIHCRKASTPDGTAPAGDEMVMLDVNALARGHDFYQVRGMEVTDSGRLLAYGEDTVSRRQYTIRFRDLETGETLSDAIPGTNGSFAWAADGQTIFYVKNDPETLRSHQVWRHRLGTPNDQDVLVHEEKDTAFYTGVRRSRSRAFVFIELWSTLVTEIRMVDANKPEGAAVPVLPREPRHEYSVAHHGDHFYVRTNWEAANFRLMRAPIASAADKSTWREVLPHRADALLMDVLPFKDHLVVSERKDGLKQIRVRDHAGTADRYLDFGQDVYVASPWWNPEVDTTVLRYTMESPTTPESYYAHELASGETTLLKQDEVPGFDPARYKTERMSVTVRDGARVPVSLVYPADFKPNGSSPLYVYGYGSYGFSMDPWFSRNWLSLLDRGFVIAIAHVRGGQELGRAWYESGKLFQKENTFNDFVDVTEHLIIAGYGKRGEVIAEGGSAGGLLMGAVINLRPDLYAAVHAAVPFVDVVTTMLDESIPLTTNEYDEWGNPGADKAAYEYMLSYSPYDNVEAKAYPALLVTAGLHDSQVQYFEPAKWVAKLRAMKTDDRPLLLQTEMETGHGGAAGRYKRLERKALVYAFFLWVLDPSLERWNSLERWKR